MATRFVSATGLKRVRGLGAAHAGVHHWWLQRATAAGNLLLGLWFVASLVFLPDLSRATVTGWLAEPVNAIPMLLLVLSTVWHMRLGVQVMVEDYVSVPGRRRLLLLLLDLYAVAIAATSLFAILKIAFGAANG
ncbi:succinate dehydrogenase, hydrophobic membrane anchor protein [Thermaurantiacus tibetensis]|uniref:succinate dehydrogenase, hydrophobic membrane anchor protein n=1 Tax=Thermaurantiacus tibetensis TaxID=2759035 RepID=UPI00188FF1AF|nr:succinate dehydrogenase, hydrophobic membrane anchor protein [Thermaurantiacus tibetensis]